MPESRRFKTLEDVDATITYAEARSYSEQVFHSSVPGFFQPKLSVPIGACVDAVSTIIASIPDYLTACSSLRHLSLLEHFGRAGFDERLKPHLSGKFRDQPLTSLDNVLHHWIEDHLHSQDDERGPFFATCALDTALTLWAHIIGASLWTERHRWKIAPLLEGDADAFRGRRESLDSPRLKSDITRSLGQTLLLVFIPSGDGLEMHYGDLRIDGPRWVVVKVNRCHLSTGVYDRSDFRVHRGLSLATDLTADFWFYVELELIRIQSVNLKSGSITFETGGKRLSHAFADHMYAPTGHIPGDWIAATLTFDWDASTAQCRAVPWFTGVE